MKFTLVTYRWHPSLIGGAETYHRRLAQELIDLGHDVEVLTTDGGAVRTCCHWGVEWSRLTAEELAEPDFLPVRRVPIRPARRPLLAAMARVLQRRMEREAQALSPADYAPFLPPRDGSATPRLMLLSGWHYPEISPAGIQRWSMGRALLLADVPAGGGRVGLSFHSPKGGRVRLLVVEGNTLRDIARIDTAPGHNQIDADLPGGRSILAVEARPWRPLREFRTLGLLLSAAWLGTAQGTAQADMAADYRSLGREQPAAWAMHLARRAEARPRLYGMLMDRLRGPIANLRASLPAPSPNHVTIHANLPWANISLVRPGDVVLPFWHTDDEFYFWPHWLERLREARLVLGINPFTGRRLFPAMGLRAAFVGTPVWEPDRHPPPGQVAEFRQRHGITPGQVLVLTVSRKSAEKRYDVIAEAVGGAIAEGTPLAMLGIGPDADQKPFVYTGCRWLGRASDEELQLAYAACDIFVLMSESESFGIVVVEAWHHGKPVIVNGACATTASIVEHEADGLLATAGPELRDTLSRLAGDEALRHRLGEAGRAKARREYGRGATAGRLLQELDKPGDGQ